MKPQGNEEYVQTETVNPLHVMEDDELLSRFKLESNTSGIFQKYRQELLHRLRKSHLENWTPPKRFPEHIPNPKEEH